MRCGELPVVDGLPGMGLDILEPFEMSNTVASDAILRASTSSAGHLDAENIDRARTDIHLRGVRYGIQGNAFL